MEYWNARYREERGLVFDWYINWKQGLRDIVIPRLYDDKEAEILVVGCGNSGKFFINLKLICSRNKRKNV